MEAVEESEGLVEDFCADLDSEAKVSRSYLLLSAIFVIAARSRNHPSCAPGSNTQAN